MEKKKVRGVWCALRCWLLLCSVQQTYPHTLPPFPAANTHTERHFGNGGDDRRLEDGGTYAFWFECFLVSCAISGGGQRETHNLVVFLSVLVLGVRRAGGEGLAAEQLVRFVRAALGGGGRARLLFRFADEPALPSQNHRPALPLTVPFWFVHFALPAFFLRTHNHYLP